MPIRRSLLIGILLGHSLGWLFGGSVARAGGSTGSVLISELQVSGGSGLSGNEFVELYNPTAADISLDKWLLQYHAATSTDCTKSWSTKATISKLTIKSHGYLLAAATGYLTTADVRFSAGLSDSAGAVRLVAADASVSDAVGWGSAVCGLGTALAAPTGGASLERLPGADIENGGNAYNTGDNANDFELRAVPQPQGSNSPIEDPAPYPVADAAPQAVTYLPLRVTELLVDPVSPQTDAHDEFVELQNQNTEALDIGGYAVKSGGSLYHLPHQILAPGAYAVITSGGSTISLANAGGSVEVLDPSGVLIDQSAPWPAAVPGASWALFADGWAWTTTPTPAAANLETDPSVPAVTTPGVGDSGDQAPAVYAPLALSELLVDPAAPASDANDEFVELYNPSDDPVDTAGYVIKSGGSLGNTTTLADHTIDPHGYLALMSSETGLALANSGSRVVLYDPVGNQLGDEVDYTTAPTGDAWALGSAGWAWTTTPTPNAENVITAPVVVAKAVKPVKTPAVKTAKIKAPTKAKTVSTKKTTAKTPAKPQLATLVASHATDHWLLFGLIGLTLGYISYEFRYDIRHLYHRARGHAGARPKTR